MKNTIRKILIEELLGDDLTKSYEPFWYKHNAKRLGGTLSWSEHNEWVSDENIKRWEKEERLHAAPLVDYTFGVYVIKGDNEVIDYILNKFSHEKLN